MFTLVFLHGWGHSRAQWETISEKFRNDFRVVTWDLPGFGSEPAPEIAWGVPEYATWVKERIMREGLQNVVLIGHSFGGRISSWIAAEQPIWLKGLVLYGAPCLYRPSLKIRFKNFIGHWGGKFPVSETLRRQYRGEEENNASQKGMRTIWRKVVSFDQTERVQRINIPTLLVWGEHDTEAPVHIAEELKKIIPHATLTVIPQGGHSVHLEQPILFYGILKRFFESLA